jgi:hypothetical protein
MKRALSHTLAHARLLVVVVVVVLSLLLGRSGVLNRHPTTKPFLLWCARATSLFYPFLFYDNLIFQKKKTKQKQIKWKRGSVPRADVKFLNSRRPPPFPVRVNSISLEILIKNQQF